MKTISKTELKSILDQHQLWIESAGKLGTRANLTGALLYCTDLHGADLHGADLGGADLRGATLTGADLRGANLDRADLYCADLKDANLTGANLKDADLKDADLTGANLTGANLTDADLTGTILEKKAEKKENVCVNSSFGEELQMLLDKHGVKLAAAIQLELK